MTVTSISNSTIELAKNGDANALDTISRSVQNKIHHLAIRMLANPEAAQDATQEILIRIVTKLSTFEGNSKFETWAYRVATNYLLTAKKALASDPGLSFQMFSDDLLHGLADEQTMAADDHVMLNELRIRCTAAMLLCLDRDHRAAYILGDIMEFDHNEAAQVFEISRANFRKRLSRARARVEEFTSRTCGLANPSAKCHCRKRLPFAVASGRVGSHPSTQFEDAPKFKNVLDKVKGLEATLVAAKLQRATGQMLPPHDIAAKILKLVDPPPNV